MISTDNDIVFADQGTLTYFVKIPSTVKLPKYEHWAMYNEWLPLNIWRVMLDMHMGPFPWRPDHAYEVKK